MDKIDRRTWCLAVASVLLASAGNARAEFPEKPVTLIVPFAAGGPATRSHAIWPKPCANG
jgi:tripartite-type tricarboxylate transporter receptor subunit TctC